MFLSAPALALVCSGGCPPACHVADGVRGRNAQTSPRDDRRQSRQPPREPSGQSGSNRRHQHSKLNRDHQEDTVEAHEAVLRSAAWDCSLKATAGALRNPVGHAQV
jgi:hypothetical protein